MSLSKRILFGDDPIDDVVRAQIGEANEQTIAAFPHKIPLRRKNLLTSKPRWDPFWPNCVGRAATELEIELLYVNDQACTRSKSEADRIKERAQSILLQLHTDFAAGRLCRRR